MRGSHYQRWLNAAGTLLRNRGLDLADYGSDRWQAWYDEGLSPSEAVCELLIEEFLL